MGSDLSSPLPGPRVRELMCIVLAARRRVDRLRAGRVDPALLLKARGTLLEAMENYAAELRRYGLPTPPALRDDLRLQRGIAGSTGKRSAS